MRKKRARSVKKRRWRRAAYFFTSFFLTLAVFGCGAGFLIVDRNTRRIGYSGEEATFALSSVGDRLDVTLLGHSVTVETQPFAQAAAIWQRARDGFDTTTLAPVRLAQDLHALSLAELLTLLQKYFAQ